MTAARAVAFPRRQRELARVRVPPHPMARLAEDGDDVSSPHAAAPVRPATALRRSTPACCSSATGCRRRSRTGSAAPTHATMHRLQERLCGLAAVEGGPGIFGVRRPRIDAGGRVVDWARKDGDEVHRVFAALGLWAWLLFGATASSLHDRAAVVRGQFAEQPCGMLVVGFEVDVAAGASRPVAFGGTANHYVVVVRSGGRWLRLDSWAAPGTDTLHATRPAEAQLLAVDSPITLFATALATGSAPDSRTGRPR